MPRSLCVLFTVMALLMSLPVRYASATGCSRTGNRLIRTASLTASLFYARTASAKPALDNQCPTPVSAPAKQLSTRPWATPSHVSSSFKHWGMLTHASKAPGPNSDPQSRFGRIASAFHSISRTITLLFRLLASLTLLICITPYIISSKWGTEAASSLASRALRGDVNIHRIQLGWWEPIALEGLQMHEGAAGDSRQLVSIPKLTSAEPLYSVVWGSNITLTISKPQIDCSLDESAQQTRLERFFYGAKLRNIFSSSSSSEIGGPTTDQQQQQQSSSVDQLPAAAAAGPTITSHPILTDDEAVQAAEHEEQLPAESAAATAAESAAAAAALSPIRQRLTVADSVAEFSAEIMMPKVAIYVPDGQLLMPAEVRAAIGPHIHAVAALGQQQVLDLADELTEDASWIQIQQQQQQQHWEPSSSSDQTEAAAAAGSSSDQASDKDPVPAAAAAAASWDIPPKDVNNKSWRAAQPVMLQVTGDHLDGLVRGWRLPGGSYVLQQPAAANWEFTRELARLTLSLYNPLLQEVGYVRQGGRLMSYYAPEGGQVPATHGQVDISSMKFVMGQGQLLKQVFKLLDMAQGSGILRKPLSADKRKAIEVWSGPTTVEIQGPGRYTTKRVDMLIGTGSTAIQVALWGTVDTTHDTLDMTIGLPASTLAKIGIKNLPESYMLPLSVSGDLNKPQLDWTTAVRKLAVLSAMQLGSRAWQSEGLGSKGSDRSGFSQDEQRRQRGLAGMFSGWPRVGAALVNAAGSFIGEVDQRLQQELIDVPPPADLPWQQQQQQQQKHSSEERSQGSEEVPVSDSGSAAELPQDNCKNLPGSKP